MRRAHNHPMEEKGLKLDKQKKVIVDEEFVNEFPDHEKMTGDYAGHIIVSREDYLTYISQLPAPSKVAIMFGIAYSDKDGNGYRTRNWMQEYPLTEDLNDAFCMLSKAKEENPDKNLIVMSMTRQEWEDLSMNFKK